MNFIYVFLGGGIGSVVRYLLGLIFQKSNLQLPLSTFLANLIACLSFALFLKWSEGKMDVNENFKFFILTGICGGLSTFSTFSHETFALIKSGQTLWALINIALSLIMGIGIFFIYMPKNTAG
ncbi:MAG: fluoride efflux transporter CrcB [Bacteroidia bacterium]